MHIYSCMTASYQSVCNFLSLYHILKYKTTSGSLFRDFACALIHAFILSVTQARFCCCSLVRKCEIVYTQVLHYNYHWHQYNHHRQRQWCLGKSATMGVRKKKSTTKNLRKKFAHPHPQTQTFIRLHKAPFTIVYTMSRKSLSYS